MSRRSRAPWLVLLALALFLVGFELLERLGAPDEPVELPSTEASPRSELVRPIVRPLDEQTIEIDFGLEDQQPLRLQRGDAEMQRLVDCLQKDIDSVIRARKQDKTADFLSQRMRRPPLKDRIVQLHRRCLHRLGAATS